MKKIISLVVAAALSCSSITLPVFATAEKTYNEWTVPTKNENLMTLPMLENNMAGSSQTAVGAYSSDKSEVEYSISNQVSQDSNRLYAGFRFNTSGEFFTPKPGTTYVCDMKVKNASTNGAKPSIGMGMCDNNGSSMIKVYPNEYGAEGMQLTDSENWMDFKITLSLPSNYNMTASTSYAQRVWSGFLNGTGEAGWAYAVKTDSLDDFYFAEEQAYDIINICQDDKEDLDVGAVVNFESEIINQIGIKGGLNQNVDWLILDDERKEVTSGFKLNKVDNKLSVTVENEAESGTYYAYVLSTEYDKMGRGVSFTVKKTQSGGDTGGLTPPIPPTPSTPPTGSYDDYVKGSIQKTENMIPDASADWGTKYFSERTSGDGIVDKLYWTTDDTVGGNGFVTKYTYNGSGTMAEAWRGVEGIVLNQSGAYFGYQAETGKTYVFSANVKNISAKGIYPVLNLATNTTYNPGYLVKANEYPNGMTLSSGWEKFNATFTIPEDFLSDRGYPDMYPTDFKDRPMFGFEKLEVGASFALDVSTPDAVYFAEEQAYDISLEKISQKEKIYAGDTVEFEAKLYNQIGTEYNGSNTFSWALLDENKTLVSDATITDGVIEIPENLATGTYYAFARASADSRLQKSIAFKVSAKEVGDDEIDSSEKPENMIGDLTAGSDFATASDENVAISFGVENGEEIISLAATNEITELSGLMPTDNQEGFGNHVFEAGKSYIVSFNAWTSTDTNVEVNTEISDGVNSLEGTACQLTSEPQTITQALRIPDNFMAGANSMIIGFAAGTQSGADIKILADSIYIAEEKAMSLKITSNGTSDVYMGTDEIGKITQNETVDYVLSASVLNQLETEGNLDQEFNWTVYEEDKITKATDITLSEAIEGNSKAVKLNIDLFADAGKYYISAVPKNYKGISKIFEITINKPTMNESIKNVLNLKDASEIEATLPLILQTLAVDETIKNNVNLSGLASLIVSNRSVAPLTGSNIKAEVEKLAIISLYVNNPNQIALWDESGNFKYAEEMGISTYFAGSTLDEVMKETTVAARIQLNEALKGSYVSMADFDVAVALNLILEAIENPEEGSGTSYIGKILTSENAEKANLTITNYLSLSDTYDADLKLARGTFTKQTLEDTISEFTESGGNSGSYGGGFGSSASAAPVVNTPTKLKFSDVPPTHWAYDYIYHLEKLNIISGIDQDTFAPESYITREQFVKLFVEAFDYEKKAANLQFKDTLNDAWYSDYIETAIVNGLIKGVSESEFGLGAPITRQDLCVIVMRALNEEADEESVLDFNDIDEISDYAKDAVAVLSDYGIVNGFDDGSFRPASYCTRAQAAKIICMIMNLGGMIG